VVLVNPSAAERALLIPSLAWLVITGTIVAASLAGHSLFQGPGDLTLAEAAVLRDHAELLRLIQSGADPDAQAAVRPGLARRDVRLLTPLEAAIGEHHPETVEFLIAHGAHVNAANVSRLLCFARQEHQEDAIQSLKSRAPIAPAADCGAIDLPWRD
jgi:hypothetical protein